MKKYEKPYLDSNEVSLNDIILLSKVDKPNIIGGDGVNIDDVFGE